MKLKIIYRYVLYRYSALRMQILFETSLMILLQAWFTFMLRMVQTVGAWEGEMDLFCIVQHLFGSML